MKLHYQIKTLPNLFIFILLRSETTSLILKKNNRKRPLNTLQSKSAVNKRLRDFGKDAKNLIDSLIESYNMNEEESHAISLRNLELDCNTEKIMINYKQMYERREIDAIVRAYHRNTITNSINNDLNIKTFSVDKIVNDLEIFEESEALIPTWKESEIIKFGDTLMLKLGGDGYNIGHKQNHVMFTVCLLNQGEEVLKPENQHCICLYIGKEKYENVSVVGKLYCHELNELRNNGIYDKDGMHWKIELYFAGDWKIMYIVMGLDAPDSKHFCLYCNCGSDICWDMDQKFENTVLENFPVCKFVPGTYGENIEKLWKEFFRLYMILHKPLHSDEEINEFEIDSKNWICSFYNTNLYGKHNVTTLYACF
nr:3116_t:CDS:2 [Entrophospora candida]